MHANVFHVHQPSRWWNFKPRSGSLLHTALRELFIPKYGSREHACWEEARERNSSREQRFNCLQIRSDALDIQTEWRRVKSIAYYACVFLSMKFRKVPWFKLIFGWTVIIDDPNTRIKWIKFSLFKSFNRILYQSWNMSLYASQNKWITHEKIPLNWRGLNS